ncbi:MAG TPA: FAD-dependent oxidoreductase [Verrucomicrobiae bacterium]|nr:FAD-dependent oxidoreductase [Verrucomicrobiae bacterium]
METQYDIVIIGGACAGLAAAMYAGRRALKVLIVTKDIGGQIATTPSVENYPAIDFITGPDLARDMMNQAIKWGAELVYDEVTKLEKRGEKDFVITGLKSTYHAKSMLLAYGKTPRNLDVPGEQTYAGRGVSYCVTCDAPLFKNRDVAVVGGGNSAMEGALILAKVCKKVYLVHRRDQFRGEAVLLEQINNEPKIELILSSVTEEVVGDGKFVNAIRTKNIVTNEVKDTPVDGIFVEIGFIVNSALIREVVELDRMNQVITNKKMETSTPGIFAAGDITDSPYKQAVISAGEGAAAALTAYSYINDGAPAGVDWSGK